VTAALRRDSRKPIRMVHLGLGNFFRAHQARYTQSAADAAEWGYAAFTVRSPRQADLLEAQDCLFTLTENAAAGSATTVVDQISAAHSGDDLRALRGYLADPAVTVVTLTITEGGYTATGDQAAADIAALTSDAGIPVSPLARLALGLDARRAADAGPISIVSCDNLPDNGGMTRDAVLAYAAGIPGLAEWIAQHVAFASTVVDRITPRLGAEEQSSLAERSGFSDAVPVVTEHFSEWVISGEFPAGRPDWESAGVVFTDDVGPFEQRKLHMLNAAHTILAITGLRRGLTTVDEAIAHPELRALVDAWWEQAGELLPEALDAGGYAAALRERFANPGLRHRLAQIAENMTVKLQSRVLPVIAARRADGAATPAGTRALAEWALAVADGVLPGDSGEPASAVLALDAGMERAELERALSDADRSMLEKETAC